MKRSAEDNESSSDDDDFGPTPLLESTAADATTMATSTKDSSIKRSRKQRKLEFEQVSNEYCMLQ